MVQKSRKRSVRRAETRRVRKPETRRAQREQEIVIHGDGCSNALAFLSTLKPLPTPGPDLQDPKEFRPCDPPSVTIPPQFVIALRRPLLFCSLPVNLGDGVDTPRLQLSCVNIGRCQSESPPRDQATSLDLNLGFDLKFNQTWNLLRLGIGDLSSTMSLAPSEQLTLEFQTSQRRVLEQTSVDSAEEMTSIESTTSDKEVVNVARSSSKTENWHVDGNGGFNIGIVSLGASAGITESTTDNSQSSLQHITEATRKSAHSLKTLHKIEVRGVTEGLIQNRMTRVIKNPYPDRALSLNIFQLIKHFSVQTALVEIRPSLIIQVNGLDFDNHFVVSNSNFLRDELLDPSLVDELPTALLGAKPLPHASLDAARNIAKLALRYLYDQPNIFNVPSIRVFDYRTIPPRIQDVDPNPPDTCFDDQMQHSGFDDAQANDFAQLFTVLNLLFKVYQELQGNAPPAPTLDDNAIAMAKTLADNIGTNWATPTDLGHVRNILDENDFTEIFRRLSGFLAIVNGMLNPLLTAADDAQKAVQAQADAGFALQRLKDHLCCHKNYYIQRFLAYIAQRTNNQDLIDFVRNVIARTGLPSVSFQFFDLERTFVDRQQIVVPGLRFLQADEITEIDNIFGVNNTVFLFGDIVPTVVEVEVPTDGIHLEAAKGACVLDELPPQTGKSVEISIHDASLKVNDS